ncbi:copper-fist-domain-containing protein [Trametes cingulata]|nr:copper-fist-domain-containing protein [Trametes cingulata]
MPTLCQRATDQPNLLVYTGSRLGTVSEPGNIDPTFNGEQRLVIVHRTLLIASPKVYVNDKKFACESCIKGHRSSNCQHTDRPLFEIKKKGRPVSQCEKCRELRKTKRMHSKCTCTSSSSAEAGTSSQPLASKATGVTDSTTSKPKSACIQIAHSVPPL